MKKSYILFSCAVSIVLLFVACESEGSESTNQNGTDNEEDIEKTGTMENDNDDEAVVIVETAIDTHKHNDSFYEHKLVDSEDGEEMKNQFTWYYRHDDGSLNYRDESGIGDDINTYTVWGNEDEGLTYVTDENTLYEFDTSGDAIMSYSETMVHKLMSYNNDNIEVNFEGEEEINGYDAYIVSYITSDNTSRYWIDKENYFVVQEESKFDELPNIYVQDYELDIQYNEQKYNLDDVLPGDVEVKEGRPDP